MRGRRRRRARQAGSRARRHRAASAPRSSRSAPPAQATARRQPPRGAGAVTTPPTAGRSRPARRRARRAAGRARGRTSTMTVLRHDGQLAAALGVRPDRIATSVDRRAAGSIAQMIVRDAWLRPTRSSRFSISPRHSRSTTASRLRTRAGTNASARAMLTSSRIAASIAPGVVSCSDQTNSAIGQIARQRFPSARIASAASGPSVPASYCGSGTVALAPAPAGSGR